MPVLRENCVVLDTSILPKRPCISEVQKFCENDLRLDMSQVKCIQPHNVKNVVYLGMESNEAANRIATVHHLKHCLEIDGRKFAIPIYVESSAVDVRLHDLPYDMDNAVIIDHMHQYGEVIAIRSEVWKSYFPGLSNGVRVVRMKLNGPISSYITVDGEVTLVSYPNQTKTCRNCERKSHPRKRCSEVVAAGIAAVGASEDSTILINNHRDSKKKEITNNTNSQPTTPTESEQWPALPKSTPRTDLEQKNKKETKRQRSIDTDAANNETKKLNANDSDESDSSLTIISSDICPYTKRPYRIPDYSYMEDEIERRAAIEEAKRRVDAAYLELEKNKRKKKNVPN